VEKDWCVRARVVFGMLDELIGYVLAELAMDGDEGVYFGLAQLFSCLSLSLFFFLVSVFSFNARAESVGFLNRY